MINSLVLLSSFAVAFPPDEPIAVGKAAARKVWANHFADPSYQISWKTSSAGVVKELGWTAETFQDSSMGSDGKIVARNEKYVCVWRKGADHNLEGDSRYLELRQQMRSRAICISSGHCRALLTAGERRPGVSISFELKPLTKLHHLEQ